MEFRISSPPGASETPKRSGWFPGPAALGASLALHGILVGGILIAVFAPSPEPLPPVIVTAELVDSAAIASPTPTQPETVSESVLPQPTPPQKTFKEAPVPTEPLPAPASAPASVTAAPSTPPLPPEPKRKPTAPTRDAEPPAPAAVGGTPETATGETETIAARPAPASTLAPAPETGSDLATPGAQTPPALAGVSGNKPPRYPLSARRRGIEGRVILAVSVGRGGAVTAIRVKQSSGAEILDRAALHAVRDWRFKPATIAGVSVAGRIDVPVTFRLK